MISEASPTCRVITYDAYSTTCTCKVTNSTIIDSSRRLLPRKLQSMSGESSFTISVATGTQYVDDKDSRSKFTSDEDLVTENDLEGAIIVLLMVVVLWAVGLILTLGCAWRRQQYYAKLKEKDDVIHRLRKSQALASNSPSAIREYLVSYVSEVFQQCSPTDRS